MKLFFKFFGVVLVLFAVISCNKDNAGQLQPGTNSMNWTLYPGQQSDYIWPTWTENNNATRNVLIENFTGHQAIEAEEANAAIDQLLSQYGYRLITTSIHASLDGINQATSTDFPADFTTPEGSNYVQSISGFSKNPSALINRKKTGNTTWKNEGEWQSEIEAALADNSNADVRIQTQFNYYPSTRGLFFHVETAFTNEVHGNLYLINALIRKEIVAPQKMTDGSINSSYVHKNVFTGNLSNNWGTAIAPLNGKSGTKIYNNYSYQLRNPAADPTFEPSNLAVISFVYNFDTKEILQVILTNL